MEHVRQFELTTAAAIRGIGPAFQAAELPLYEFASSTPQRGVAPAHWRFFFVVSIFFLLSGNSRVLHAGRESCA